MELLFTFDKIWGVYCRTFCLNLEGERTNLRKLFFLGVLRDP